MFSFEWERICLGNLKWLVGCPPLLRGNTWKEIKFIMKQSAAISPYFLVKHMGESSEIFYRMKGGVGDSPVDFFSYEGRTEFSNFFHHTICSKQKHTLKDHWNYFWNWPSLKISIWRCNWFVAIRERLTPSNCSLVFTKLRNASPLHFISQYALASSLLWHMIESIFYTRLILLHL